MKKFLAFAIVIVLACMLGACTGGGPTVDRSWANNETLVYNVYDKAQSGAKVGEAKFVTTTNISEADKKVASGTTTKMTATLKIGTQTRTTIFYANIYNVLKVDSTLTDSANNKNNYKLEGKHEGKNYVYSIKYPFDAGKDTSGKLKVGQAGYTDGEFLYFYVRCHDVSAMPSSIAIANPFNQSVAKLSCIVSAHNASVKTDNADLGTIICDKVQIGRNEKPVGRAIELYQMPDKKEYHYGEGSLIKSAKIPVKIVENNISFVLKEFSATK